MIKRFFKFIMLLFLILGCFRMEMVYSQNWQLIGTVTSPGLRPVISVSSTEIAWIADGAGTNPKIFRTTNGGLNWDVIPVVGIGHEIYCVWALSSGIAYVGEGVVNGNANLYRTSNGGMNWVSILQTGNNNGFFNGLAFTKANGSLFGLALAERLYRSTNSGLNWIEINPGVVGVSNAQNSLMIVDNNFYGFGLNNGAARLRLTTNNSGSWSTQQLSVSGNYTSAIGFHSNKLFGVAATSTSLPNIARTTDGGQTWNNVNIGAGITGECYVNWIPLTPVIYILGANGGVKRSTDNGLTWVLTPTAGVTNLTYFDFAANGNVVYGYAVSSNGSVIKLMDTLAVLTAGETGGTIMPQSFELKQNYPNPFNPGTEISFSLPVSSFVNLAVYNSLGQQVEVLFSGNKEAGVHKINWNASGYASGLYFYRISAGDPSTGSGHSFYETKKMLLIK